MRTFLSKFSPKTAIGLLVSALVIVCQFFGVNIHDLIPSLTTALGNFVNAAVGLYAVFQAFKGHVAVVAARTGTLESTNPSAPAALPIKRSPLLPILVAALGGIALCGPLTGCSVAQQQEFITTAETIGADAQSYTETLATMTQTITGLVSATAPEIETLAQQWGMLPSNSTQLAAYNKFIAAVGNVGTDAGAVNKLLTSISASGTVPPVVSTGAGASPSASLWQPHSSHEIGAHAVGLLSAATPSPAALADTRVAGIGEMDRVASF